MTERQLQFRVGIFVIAALAATALMVFQFGDLMSYWEPRYTLAIHFDEAPGVYPSTPVRRNGVAIGTIREILFDEKQGGVIVLAEIQQDVRLRTDSRPRLTRTLLGDASIEFSPGKSPKFLQHGAKLEGVPSTDPMQIFNQMQKKLNATMESFQATSRQWELVGRNLNHLLETNHGNLNLVVERAATALHEFTRTMRTANEMFTEAGKIVGDPETQANLRRTLAALPNLVDDTQATIAAVKRAVTAAGENLENLKQVTLPMAQKSTSIVNRLDSTLGNLESLTAELNDFSRAVNRKDGSLQKFVSDPELYRNLNRTAASLSVLLKNMEPIMRDIRIFSDKIARHPEVLGASGALKGSSGLKDPPVEQSPRRGRAANRKRTKPR